MGELVVVMGAGASHDCAGEVQERRTQLQPPLTKGIFGSGDANSDREFARIMNAYPLVQMVAAEVGSIRDDTFQLETFLRERLRDSQDPYARRRYRQVPLYLQDVLYHVSQPSSPADGGPKGYVRTPANYDQLLNLTLKLDRVVYITLNYDTLFDQRLGSYYRDGISQLDDYFKLDPRWLLVKLHGSINWGKPIVSGVGPYPQGLRTADYVELVTTPDELELDDEIIFLGGPSKPLHEIRYPGGTAAFYPALSAPLGSEDELSCPPNHVEALCATLAEMGDLNVLVIGYSGLDQEVIRLFRESARSIKNILVANGSAESSAQAATKLMNAWGDDQAVGLEDPSAFNGGFHALVSEGRLGEFLEGLA